MSTINPIEIKATQYYVHKSYVPSYYWVYVFLEQWIASAIFREDTSRVFMASDGYAFRRRFELTDMSKSYDEIEASSLRFPFANYNPLNSGWEADKRPAANTAALVYQGIYEGSTKVKASAVSQDIPVTFYFDREDDARLAYDTLFFYTYNEHYYSTEIPYGTMGRYPDKFKVNGKGSTLKLPVNIIIKGIRFNPNFNESDWLQRNRIFTISATFSCRTYAIFPPKQPSYEKELGNNFDYDYDDGTESFYIVNDVILGFMNDVYNIEMYNGLESFPNEGKASTIYVDTFLEEIPKKIPSEVKTISPNNYYRWNAVSKKYEEYEPYKDCVNVIRVSGLPEEETIDISRLYVKKKTATSGTIAWEVNNKDQLSSIEILLSGSSKKIILDPSKKEYTFKNLLQKSKYTAFVNFYDTSGSAMRLQISFNTETSPEPSKDLNTLVGMTW